MLNADSSRKLRILGAFAATFLGRTFVLGFTTSSISRQITLFRKRKFGRPCESCKGIGFYSCKLCKTYGTIKWSPLHDPLVINPCVCPTCDGFKVQRCLNCLGGGIQY